MPRRSTDPNGWKDREFKSALLVLKMGFKYRQFLLLLESLAEMVAQVKKTTICLNADFPPVVLHFCM